jgi:DNA-binding HxlR family transcriptional regulator
MEEFARMIIDVFRRRWCLDAVYALGDGPLRFTELQHAIGRASPEFPHAAVLQKALRVLEEHGYIEHDLDTVPPVYRLTCLGESVRGKIVETDQWCRDRLNQRRDEHRR